MVAYISNTNCAAIYRFEKVHYQTIDFQFLANIQSVEWTISARIISLSKVDLQNFQSMNKFRFGKCIDLLWKQKIQ